jgi:hypothetical protein
MYGTKRTDSIEGGNLLRSVPIVKNVFDRSIAAEIRFGERGGAGMPDHFWDGSVLLVPVLSGWDTSELANKILRNNLLHHGDHPEQETTPEWLEEFSVPGESDVTEEISEVEAEIGSLEDRLREKQNDLENLREFKVLLYGNEDQLENLVPSVFERMGFDIDGEKSHGRDGAIHLENQILLLEITGTTGGISHSKCGQLDRWVRDSELENPDESYGGLLIVNPFRETRPENRSGYLSPDVVEIMEKWGYKILTTTYLFELFTQSLRGNLDKNDIQQLLTNDEAVLDTN